MSTSCACWRGEVLGILPQGPAGAAQIGGAGPLWRAVFQTSRRSSSRASVAQETTWKGVMHSSAFGQWLRTALWIQTPPSALTIQSWAQRAGSSKKRETVASSRLGATQGRRPMSWSTTTVRWRWPRRSLISSMPMRRNPAKGSERRRVSVTTRSTMAPAVANTLRMRWPAKPPDRGGRRCVRRHGGPRAQRRRRHGWGTARAGPRPGYRSGSYPGPARAAGGVRCRGHRADNGDRTDAAAPDFTAVGADTDGHGRGEPVDVRAFGDPAAVEPEHEVPQPVVPQAAALLSGAKSADAGPCC